MSGCVLLGRPCGQVSYLDIPPGIRDRLEREMPVKVCPRCSYVDIEGRRVCLACRGSLMGTVERELFEVLELREQAFASGDDSVRAPWGPGLKAIVEQTGRDLATGGIGDVAGSATLREGGSRRRSSAGTPPPEPPSGPPRPVRSPGGGAVEPDLRGLEMVMEPVAHAATAVTTAEPVVARAMPSDFARPIEVVAPVVSPAVRAAPLDASEARTAPVDVDPLVVATPTARRSVSADPPVRTPTAPTDRAQPGSDDLAAATRRQLTDLYDARRAAASRLDGDPVTEARPNRVTRGRTARPTFGRMSAVRSALKRGEAASPDGAKREDPITLSGAKPVGEARTRPVRARRPGDATPESRSASPRTRKIQRIVAAVVVLTVGFVGVRAVQRGFEGDDRAVVADPGTPFDKLPWHVQSIGDVRVRVPASPTVGAGSSYQRYTLPDIELAVAVRPAVPSLTTDVALRTYTSQLVAQFGGRYVGGHSQGSSFGAGFSAEAQIDGQRLLVYVLSTPDALVEVQGTILATDATRATAIFDRAVNSIEVG